MERLLLKLANNTISISFYLLFFLTPLLLTPFNYELFEYNKMMFTYAATIVIASSWIIKMILEKEIKIRRSPFDLPLLLFLLSQVISTVFSIDRHVSLFGYYSRFNGGLLSTISYIILYYAFITNFPKEKIKKLLIVALSSGLLVSIYAILEHFGIDKNLWVQDVQNRVFSTLGQPNWLAAYLAVLIPITFGLLLEKSSSAGWRIKFQINMKFIGLLGYWVIGLLFYITLIFTKSRSGFMGFWVANILFWVLLFLKYKKSIIKFLLIFNFSFLIFNFILGSPFSQLDRFTLSAFTKNKPPITQASQAPPLGESILDVGITESGNIRKIVWKGSLDIIKNYPLFGSGVETFAFSYYKFRPPEHNMTSEWDFLYNKAHNEYLNYAATTGLVGLGSYLLFIGSFILYFVKQLIIKSQAPNNKQIPNPKNQITKNSENWDLFGIWNLEFGIFTAWFSILITNFLGFSVVIIQIFFFLIPAISYIALAQKENYLRFDLKSKSEKISLFQIIGITFSILLPLYLIATLISMWIADSLFAKGYHNTRAGNYIESYQQLKNAINLNSGEPLYFDEISYPAASLALAAHQQKETSPSEKLTQEAISASDIAIKQSPNNVNYWKTRTRVFYALTDIDGKYISNAISALTVAHDLSPTDPKILYNLGLLYAKIGDNSRAIASLAQATALKPDYKDAHFALALFYKEDGKFDQAREELEFILKRIAPDDTEAKKLLEELR